MPDRSQITVGEGTSPGTGPSASGSSSAAPNGFHQRTYGGLLELLGDGWTVLRSARRLRSIYVHERVDEALREQIMLAVSRVNACRWCAHVHGTRAAQQSAKAELADVTPAARASESRARTAVAYAVARAEAGRGRGPHPQVEQAFRERFDAQERHDVEAVIRLITFANLSANSLHSLSDRLRPSRRRTVAQVVAAEACAPPRAPARTR